MLDTFDGQCWIGVVPFWMSGVRARGLPAVPGFSRFPELNVRTYVTYGGSLEFIFSAWISPAILRSGEPARSIICLIFSCMDCRMKRGEFLTHEARNDARSLRSRGGPGIRLHEPVEFVGSYRPTALRRIRDKGSLEDFLTARYCLYTLHQSRVYRCDIHHLPWPLQDAEANGAQHHGSGGPDCVARFGSASSLFSETLDVLIWPLRRAEE